MANVTRDIPSGFRVIIVGGGLAGLTLASALEKANVDFVLLEARQEIAPQMGASIGFRVNGLRVIDQLGALDELYPQVEPLLWHGEHYENGDYICPLSDLYQLSAARTGYPTVFVDRQIVLRALSNSIKQKEKILLGKRITKIEHSDRGIEVFCTDGTSYHGDILAGADGVKSTVRREMWRLANEVKPGVVSEEEQTAITAEYQALFGIANDIPELPRQSFHITYAKDVSTMTATSKDGRVYFFVFKKLDRLYGAHEIPRFSTEDTEAFALANSHLNIMPKGLVKVEAFWRNRRAATLVAIEEGSFKHWTWGRIACLGDSIHKMTPNAGQGGGLAVETAAALANAIKGMTLEARTNHPPISDIKKWLNTFQRNRKDRIDAIVDRANALTRVHAMKSTRERIMAHFVIPRLGDALADLTAELTVGATKLDFLPPPTRSMMGNSPFNPEQGITKHESVAGRAIFALPFLILFAFAQYNMGFVSSEEQARVFLSGLVEAHGGTWRVDSMPLGWWHNGLFLADFGILYTIMLIESARRASSMTIIQLPVVFGLVFQKLGVGSLIGLYFFLHYIFNQIFTFHATDRRLTDLSWTRSILASMLLIYYSPFITMWVLRPAIDARHWANWVWQIFPIWIMMVQRLSRTTGLVGDTVKFDRVSAPLRDLNLIKATIGCVAAISAGMHILAMICSPFSIVQIHLYVVKSTKSSLAESIGTLEIPWNERFLLANAFLWIGYMFWDLKAARMLRENWGLIVLKGSLAAVTIGPGAAIALGWWTREYVLATRKHKGAIVPGQNDGVVLPMERQTSDNASGEKGVFSNGHARRNGTL